MPAATEAVAVAGELHAPRAGVASLDNATGHQNMQQLIQLRWFAVVGQVVTILVVHYGFAIRLPLDHMLQVLTCLALFNMVSLLRSRSRTRVAVPSSISTTALSPVRRTSFMKMGEPAASRRFSPPGLMPVHSPRIAFTTSFIRDAFC